MNEKLSEKLELINSYKVKHNGNELHLINELKKIPRAGKHLRLDKAGIILPKRSVFDHLISLGRNTQIFSGFLDFDFNIDKFLNIIAFHDLAEAIIGDVPYFTTSELAKDLYKTKDNKDKEEEIANKLILETFTGDLKSVFKIFLNEGMSKDFSNEMKYFNFLDRVDPVLNVWKYILLFKSEINIDEFLDAMNDFFINPNLVKYSLNNDTLVIINFLQNKNFAKDFYNDGTSSFDYNLNLNKSKIDLFKSIFDTREMHFIG